MHEPIARYRRDTMQLELTRLSDLAVEALLALGRADDVMSGQELAAEVGTTPEYLPRIVKPLRAAGWVDSMTGPTGGYRLATALDQISLLELVEACEGPMDVGECPHHGPHHRDGDGCVLHEPWRRATTSFLAELRSTTLADIVR